MFGSLFAMAGSTHCVMYMKFISWPMLIKIQMKNLERIELLLFLLASTYLMHFDCVNVNLLRTITSQI